MSDSQQVKEPPLTLDDIDAGLPLVEEKVKPTASDLLEQEAVDSKRLENKLARSKIKDRKADRSLRNTYANRILRYLEWYSGVVAVLLFMQAFRLRGFYLPTEVIATLVGSTALAAIGLVGFIARGLFRPPKD